LFNVNVICRINGFEKSRAMRGFTTICLPTLTRMPVRLSLDTILFIVGKELLYKEQKSSLTVAYEILPLTAEKAINCISLSVKNKEFKAEIRE